MIFLRRKFTQRTFLNCNAVFFVCFVVYLAIRQRVKWCMVLLTLSCLWKQCVSKYVTKCSKHVTILVYIYYESWIFYIIFVQKIGHAGVCMHIKELVVVYMQASCLGQTSFQLMCSSTSLTWGWGVLSSFVCVCVLLCACKSGVYTY